MSLDDQARARALVSVPRNEALWRYEVTGHTAGSMTRLELAVIETSDGEPVGTLSHIPVLWNCAVALTRYEVRAGVSWRATWPAVLQYVVARGRDYVVRDPTTRFTQVQCWHMGSEHPLYRAVRFGKDRWRAYALYTRIADLTEFCRAVTPALERRVATSPLAGHTGELTLGAYRSGVRLRLDGGRITAEPWHPALDVMGQEFGAPSRDPRRPMALFPELSINQLLLGYRSLDELQATYPDCIVHAGEGRALIDILFPKARPTCGPWSSGERHFVIPKVPPRPRQRHRDRRSVRPAATPSRRPSMRRLARPFLAVLAGSTLALATLVAGVGAQSKEPVKIGLAAAVSGGSAASGEAIKRGIQIAMDEVNAKGGVLGGRKLELVIRDDEGNPAKGVTIARELVEREKATVVFGGLHTTVALAQVPVWAELKTPYMGAWAAGTNITRNGQTPNFSFRVSANDDYVDKFLSRYAVDVMKKGKPGLLLENTAWGQSNEAGLGKWLGEKKVKPVGIEKFNWNDPDMSPQLLRLKGAGADHVILVANAPEGAQVVKSRAKIGWEVPMISHWGISGGRFAELTGELSDGVVFVQTYSFFGKQNERGQALLKALREKYNVKGPEDVVAPVGTANAYDGLHLVALAIEQAGSTEGPKVREALESLKGEYKGLIKTYKQPFSAEQHDALTDADYVMVAWKGGKIVPVDVK